MLAESSSHSSDAFFGRKLLFLLGLILVAFCPAVSLAKFIFNLFATVPMAYFSLKVLMSSRVSPDSYQSVVLYWFVYGVFLFLDMVCAQSFRYKLFKICVLLFVAHYVTECNTGVFNEIMGNDGATTNRKSVRSIRSLSFDSRSPTCKDFATTVSSHCTGIRSDLLSSRESSMPFSDNEWDLSPAFLRSINNRSVRATSSEGKQRMLSGFNNSLILDDEAVLGGFAKGTPKSSSHIESRSTFSIGNGDIVISSLDKIELLPNGFHLLTVVNSSTENIMWALKSNALQYLSVAPACGVIVSGAVVTIQLVRRENAPISSKTEHQLAIDYALVGSVLEYTSIFVNTSDKKEHLWTVKFNQE